MKKIVIPNLPIPMLQYIVECVHSISDENLQCLLWNINQTSIVDMCDEIRPDIVFLHPSQLNSTFQAMYQELNFKYIVIADNPIPKNLPYPPNAVIDVSPSHGLDTGYEKTIRAKPMSHVIDLKNAQVVEKYKSTIIVDASFAILNNDVMGLLAYLSNNYSTKIIGNQTVRLHSYVGRTNIIERANLFKSADIVIDIAHIGDCWEAAYLRTPTISIHPPETNTTMLYCENLAKFQLHIDSLLNNDLIRSKYIDQCYDESCKNTSFHFCSRLFDMIDEAQISSRLINILESYK